MRTSDKYPDIFKVLIGWQINFNKTELFDALMTKRSELKRELERIEDTSSKYTHTGVIDKNPAELIQRIHSQRFSGFRASEIKSDIKRCDLLLAKVETNQTQLNQRDLEWLGKYIDLPGILRRVADELEPYYRE